MTRLGKVRIIGFMLVISSSLACSDKNPSSDTEGDLNALLNHNCFNWPEEEFSPDNFVQDLTPGVSEGETAPDFKLKDVDGNDFVLSELLESKPVLLVFGSYT